MEHAKRQEAFAPGVGLPGRIWAGGCPVWVPDVARDANFPRAAVAAGEGLHGAVGFPIGTGTGFLGSWSFLAAKSGNRTAPSFG